MSRYRRIFIPGATYFFTVCLTDRGSDQLIDNIRNLRTAYAMMQAAQPVRTDAIVILPDHLHAVWTLPKGDMDFPNRWRLFKGAFSKNFATSCATTTSKLARGEKGIWQRRYWEHLIRDKADLAKHLAYCWGNPVKHGLAQTAEAWPYSSLQRDIRLGCVPFDWSNVTAEGKFGEPA